MSPVATARVDLSVSSSTSFGVVRFVRSSLCSMIVNRLPFFASMKLMEDRCCCISWSFVQSCFVCFVFARRSRRSCLVFLLASRAPIAGRPQFVQGIPLWLDLRSPLGLGGHSLVGRLVLLLGVVVFAGSCCRSRCRIESWFGRRGGACPAYVRH